MMRNIKAGKSQAFNGQFDVTRYIFSCPCGGWQVQGGCRARSDVGGAQALAECFALAAMDHICEAHPDGIGGAVEFEDGSSHPYGARAKGGEASGALVAERMPEWVVDRG